MPPSSFERLLGRVSARAVNSPSTPAAVQELAADIHTCTKAVTALQAAEMAQYKAAHHIAQMAVLPLRSVAAYTETAEVTQVLDTLQDLVDALLHVRDTCAASGLEVSLPSELVTAWSAAARQVLAAMRLFRPRQPDGSRKQARPPVTVQLLVSTMLQLWHIMLTNSCHDGTTPLSKDTVVATASEAAELAIMQLTSEPLPEAAGQPQARFLELRGHAALALHLLADVLSRRGPDAGLVADTRNPGPGTLALISDNVQEALALHLAVLLGYDYHKQQDTQSQAAGSSSRPAGSSSRPAGSTSSSNSLEASAHRDWLQAAGFPCSHIGLYGDTVQQVAQNSGFASGSRGQRNSAPMTSPVRLQITALSALQYTMNLRAAAVCQPGWLRRCRGLIAAAATSRQEVVTDPASRRDGRLFAPGVDSALLQLLAIELSCICCWDADGGAAVGAAMYHMAFLVQQWTPRNLDPTAVRAVLQHLWLGLGETLLAATGVAEPGGEEEADQATASSSRSSQQPLVTRVGLMTSAGRVQLPADAATQKLHMWSRFSTTLFRTFTWADDVYKAQSVTEMVHEQPDLATRVIEVAARASLEHKHGCSDVYDHAKLLNGLKIAWNACKYSQLPEEAKQALITKRSLASRWCSMNVSLLKALEARAVLPGLNPFLLGYLLQNASYAACTIPIYDLAEQLSAGSAATHSDSLQLLAGPASLAWLFAGGRALVTAGKLLRYLPTLPLDPPTVPQLLFLSTYYMPVQFISTLLAALQQQLDAGPQPGQVKQAAAAATSKKAIAAAQQQVSAFLQTHGPLFTQCGTAMVTPGALPAAFRTLSAACAQGDMPAALQAVGASVCAAFPQRFACNDPDCGALKGLTEAACAQKKCSGCKVARYCCKEHQLSHWPAHKVVCKHLQKLAAAPAAAAPAPAPAAVDGQASASCD